MLEELKVFSGTAHPALAKGICQHLEIPLGRAEVFRFSNENTFVRYLDNIRHRDVFIVQPFSSPVNSNIMELLIMLDAAKRASAGRITAVIPYYAYGRTDKKDQPRVPITARLLADLISVAGADRVLTIDLHAPQIQGFFNIPVDELTALPILSRYFAGLSLEGMVVVATDVGITKKARDLAAHLKAPLAIIEKRRVGNEDKTETLTVIGEVRGVRALLVDDEIDTGGSIVSAADALLKEGAAEVYACCTHPVFSGQAIRKLADSPVKRVVVTDTLPLPPGKANSKVTVLTTAPLLGEAIRRIHLGESVGAMFQEETEA